MIRRLAWLPALAATAPWAVAQSIERPAWPVSAAEVRLVPALSDAQAPAATVEVDSRRGAPTAEDTAGSESWRMRVVRWSGAADRPGVGLSIGMGLTRQAEGPPGQPAEAQRVSMQAAPELGVRWRSGWRGDRRWDVDAWHSYQRATLTAHGERPANHARVELQFRDAKDSKGLDIPRGAFGIQTSANSQWVLRAKRGGPMVYYRARW